MKFDGFTDSADSTTLYPIFPVRSLSLAESCKTVTESEWRHFSVSAQKRFSLQTLNGKRLHGEWKPYVRCKPSAPEMHGTQE